MYGIHYQLIVYMYASSVNVFNNRIDNYLVKGGVTLRIRESYT